MAQWRCGSVVFLVALVTLACGGATAAAEPALGPRAAPAQSRGPAVIVDTLRREPHPADVAFLRAMIPHHQQALEMTALVAGRSGRDAVRLLARRLEQSQEDEIAMMRRWLADRGVPQGDAHAHDGGEAHRTLMPGMLTREELERLSSRDGGEFDRLFLELMIRHHVGALTMVEELFVAGGGQESEIFQLASHMDSDQRMEITRMRRMLAETR